MLEKVWIEVLVEPVDELGLRLLPDDFVGERQLRVQLKLDASLGRQVDVDNLENKMFRNLNFYFQKFPSETYRLVESYLFDVSCLFVEWQSYFH